MSTKNLSLLLKPVREIFVNPYHLLSWVLLVTLIFSLAVLYPNLETLIHIFQQDHLSFTSQIGFLVALYGGVFTNFSLLLFSTTVTITLLTATQIILLYRLIKERGQAMANLKQYGTVTFIGTGLATLGLGCAACGALVLGSLLSVTGGTWLLTYLPWHGQEIAFVAILVLITSNYYILRRLSTPLTC